ncbi:MAG: LPS-assembly protein LptD [Pelagibacterales bacterium]|nr:LPS-assembly protein LptD [Pelagibacterales bacterium]
MRKISLLKATLLSIITFSVTFSQENIIAEPIDTLKVNKKDKKALLLDDVKYDASDSIIINQKNNKISLYNNAKIVYGDIELTSGLIILDYKKNEVYAGRISDNKGNLSQYPVFTQGGNTVNPDSIKYNFDNQKALIWNSKSAENGMNILSALTKKQNDSVYFLKDGKVTTGGKLEGGETEDADYYFRIRKGKLVPGGKIITGFTNLYIADVPTPIGLPFAYFPSQETKEEAGFIIPNINESNKRGYSFQNGGYYLPISQYLDMTILGDYYTNGSYGINISSQYKKLYKYSGNFTVRYENLINGERGLPGYLKSTVYNVRWTHSKDSKSSPYSSLSASVNFGSSDYFRQSVNQLNTPNFLNNNLSSSVSYSKTIPGNAGIRLSLTSSMSQNTQSKEVNLTLPTLTLNTARFYPLAKKGGSKKGILQNINIQYSSKAENRTIVSDSLLFKKGMFENAKNGMQHNIPFTTNFKAFKHFSISLGGNLTEVWAFKTKKYNNFNETDGVLIEDVKGFDRFMQYNYNVSIGTTIYGTLNFKPEKKIQSIRHTIKPNISYSNSPSFEQYYDTYIIDAEGNTAEYTRFDANGLYGVPRKSFGSSISLSLQNTFEAKVKSKDSTKTELEKIKLLDNLNISTSYSLSAEEFNLSPIRLRTGFTLFKNMKFNTGATFDAYALDENNIRINTFNIKNGGGLLRLTSANVSAQYQLNNNTFKKSANQDQIDESTSGGGRADDLFGVAQDFSDSRQSEDYEDAEPVDLTKYIYNVPWDINLAYSLTYANNRNQNDFSTNSLMISSNVTLTPKWRIGISTGYDFKQKGFTYTQLRFDRDLKSWKLDFSWVPFGQRSSWNFFIGIKSGLLSDLKYEKKSEPDKRL